MLRGSPVAATLEPVLWTVAAAQRRARDTCVTRAPWARFV